MHLTLEQDAIYRRLIDHYMITQEPILSNDTAICRIVGCSPDAWSNAKPMLNAFFEEINGYLHHDFCNNLLDDQAKRQKKRSNIAKKAATKRWNKKKNPKMLEAMHKPCSKHARSNANAMHKNATGQDSISQKEIPNGIPKKLENENLKIAFELYNETAKKNNLPIAQKFTNTRKAKLKNRLKDCGGIEGWKTALQKIENSNFLLGVNGGWKADFDFVLQEKSFVKIMEGAYDDTNSSIGQTGNRNGKLSVDEELQQFLDKLGDEDTQSDDLFRI